MSNPTDPTATPATPTVDLTASTQANAIYQAGIDALTKSQQAAVVAISNTVTALLGLNDASKKTLESTNSNVDVFDLLTTEVLGATKAFDEFTSHSAGLNLFTSQVNELGEATSFTSNIMTTFATKMGLPMGAIGKTGEEIKNFITKIATSADGAIKLQQEYIGMMAATGGLNQVYADAGTNLENLNDMMQVQRTLIDDVADSTGTSAAKVSSFYAALGHAIPESTDLQVNAGQKTGITMNNLEAAMKLATGTGRSQADMVKDLSTAWETYGLEGDKALEFVERMSDLSSKFNINLDYTRNFINENASAFKLLSIGGTDAADTFNKLFPALRETGISAKEASELIAGVTTSVSKLTMAQKVHLSQQMGGPGGLRGAFQVEDMINKGQIDKLLEAEKNDILKRTGGRIFTREEAVSDTTGYAAQQLNMQRQMLQSGAFGGMVKDTATAERLLEAWKKGTSSKEALEPVANTVSKSVDRGTALQQTTNTILSQQLRNLERLRGLESIKDLNLLQGTVGTRAQGAFAETAENLRNVRTEATNRANVVSGISNQHAGGVASTIDVSKERLTILSEAFKGIRTMVPEAMRPVLDSVMEALTSPRTENQTKGNEEYQKANQQLIDQQKSIEKTIREHGTASPQDQGKLNEITRERAALANLGQMYSQYTGRSLGVAQAAQTSTINQPPERANRGRAGDAPIPAQQTQKVVVETKGIYCTNCFTKLPVNQHTNIITGGALNPTH